MALASPARRRAAHRAAALAFAACAAARTAAAQPPDELSFDGTWTVGMPQRRSARLAVADFGGSWQERGAPAPYCGGRKVPITVQTSTTTALEFTVWGSAVSPACADLQVAARPLDARTLEGTRSDGVALRLVRRR